MTLLVTILLASLAESLVSFSGGLLAFFNAEKIRRFSHFAVSFAIGALLSVSLLELIPEAAEKSSLGFIMPFVLGGMIFFFVVEKFLSWYHHHEGREKVHEVRSYAYLILWGDFLHNFIDGVIIALTFMADFRLGLVTTLAVILHEIPQEIGDFGVLLHAGFSRWKALCYNFLVSLSTIFGAIIAIGLRGVLPEAFIPAALAVIAGNLIYLAASDLMPELQESVGVSHTLGQLALIILGAILVIAPEFILGGH